MGPAPSPQAVATVASITAEVLTDVPPDLVLRGPMAWVEVFGVISWELFGHLVGVVSDADAFFDHVVLSTAASVGVHAGR